MEELSSVMGETTEEEMESSEDEVEENLENYLRKICKLLSPPTKKADVKSKWHAIMCEKGKKKYLYIGRALKRFLTDKNGVINFLQMIVLNNMLVVVIFLNQSLHTAHVMFTCVQGMI